jgi:hypothetical protein
MNNTYVCLKPFLERHALQFININDHPLKLTYATYFLKNIIYLQFELLQTDLLSIDHGR